MANGFGKRKIYHRGSRCTTGLYYFVLSERLGNDFIYYMKHFNQGINNIFKHKFDVHCGEKNLEFLRKFL